MFIFSSFIKLCQWLLLSASPDLTDFIGKEIVSHSEKCSRRHSHLLSTGERAPVETGLGGAGRAAGARAWETAGGVLAQCRQLRCGSPWTGHELLHWMALQRAVLFCSLLCFTFALGGPGVGQIDSVGGAAGPAALRASLVGSAPTELH